ncbi:MAG: MerR family transcriptional regulator [Pygmaiobacter sp.]
MQIKEACRAAGLTKKAVEYYAAQALISPLVQENGYRDFSDTEVENLKKIAVLRRLGLTTSEIRAVLLAASSDVLARIAVQKQLLCEREERKQALLCALAASADYAGTAEQLFSLEETATIADRLLDFFPGQYGQLISLHFSAFLSVPITTPTQRQAFKEIVHFLDSTPALEFPPELSEFLAETASQMDVAALARVNRQAVETIYHPDTFLADRQPINDYLAYKQSAAYRDSPVFELQECLRKFCKASGYYDVFLPALRRLSPPYADYALALETANRKLMEQYPKIAEFYSAQP